MLTKPELSPQEIKDQKVYLEWGLTEEEYTTISKKSYWVVFLTTPKPAYFQECGVNTVHTKTQNKCLKKILD